MEALIPIQRSAGGRDVVSARLLWQFLEVGTEFARWMTRRIEEYGFQENADFSSILTESTGGRQASDYVLTLDMAKELSMVERNDKGQQARRYFIACEKMLREAVTLPDFTDAAVAARAWADEREARQIAEKSVAAQLAQIAADAPKVEFANAVAVAGNCLSMSKAAKALKIPGVGRTKLFEMLRRDRILMGSNEPYANHIQHVQVEVQTFQTNSGVRVTITPRVTPAGLEYLQKRYKPAQSTTLTISQ